jgi:hypothetical protein
VAEPDSQIFIKGRTTRLGDAEPAPLFYYLGMEEKNWKDTYVAL